MKTGMFSFLLACPLLVGCATTANYEKNLQSWIGSNEDRLVSRWGPPSDSYPLSSGGKMLTWFASSAPGMMSSYNPYTRTMSTVTYSYWCKTTMTVDSIGTIVNWRWEGNACRAYPE